MCDLLLFWEMLLVLVLIPWLCFPFLFAIRYLVRFPFLFPIKYLVTKIDLRCFIALAGMLPAIGYVCTCRSNSVFPLNRGLPAMAEGRSCGRQCPWFLFTKKLQSSSFTKRGSYVELALHSIISYITSTYRSYTGLYKTQTLPRCHNQPQLLSS